MSHTKEWADFDDTQAIEWVNGKVSKIWISKQQYDYANACVNACAGMKDPSAEIN